MHWLRRSTPAEGQAGPKAHDGPQGSVHGRPEIEEEMRGRDRGGRGYLCISCIPSLWKLSPGYLSLSRGRPHERHMRGSGAGGCSYD